MSYPLDQTLSLMIPRVFPQWIDEQKIIDIFHKQQLGQIYKVSIIRMPDSKKRSYPIYQAYIYFNAWYDNEIAYNFQQRILGVKAQARVVYDDPWFWVVFENTKKRLSNNDKRIMRLGYKTYMHEQAIIDQDQRITQLEERQEAIEEKAEWYLAAKYIEANVAAERSLIETATGVAEAVLDYDSVDCTALDTPTKMQMEEWYSSHWISFHQNQCEAAAMKILGAELELTETAMRVAEAALAE